MAGDRCTVSQMADVIMEGLEEYAQLAADDMKKAVKKAGTQARKDIQENAPVKTGAYAKSWAAKTTKETANAMEIVVYSRNRYQLAHLLEFGHALRKGQGRFPILRLLRRGLRRLWNGKWRRH